MTCVYNHWTSYAINGRLKHEDQFALKSFKKYLKAQYQGRAKGWILAALLHPPSITLTLILPRWKRSKIFLGPQANSLALQ